MRAVVVTVVLLLLARSAAADSARDACITANAAAQAEALDGHFSRAHAALLQCAAEACPRIVRTDCAHQLAALEERQPTLLLAVHDDTGRDRVDVAVALDGKLWLTKLDGLAIAIDPGPHQLTVTAPDRPPRVESILVREGEKARAFTVTLSGAGATPPSSTSPPALPAVSKDVTPAPVDVRTRGSGRMVGIVVAGAGVAGLAIGGVFGGLAVSDWSSAKSACSGAPGRCVGNVSAANADHGDAVTAAAVSTAALLAGGAALVTGATIFFVARRGSDGAAASVSFTPSASPNGGALYVTGRF